MKDEKIKVHQLKHYLALVNRMKEAHKKLVDVYVEGEVSIPSQRILGKPLDLDFWRNRANAIEDAYRHIWEYYNKNRLQYEKDLEPKPKGEKSINDA